jgi:hypothetical protein
LSVTLRSIPVLIRSVKFSKFPDKAAKWTGSLPLLVNQNIEKNGILSEANKYAPLQTSKLKHFDDP